MTGFFSKLSSWWRRLRASTETSST